MGNVGTENLPGNFPMSVTGILNRDHHITIGNCDIAIVKRAAPCESRFEDQFQKRREYYAERCQLEHDYSKRPWRHDRHAAGHNIDSPRSPNREQYPEEPADYAAGDGKQSDATLRLSLRVRQVQRLRRHYRYRSSWHAAELQVGGSCLRLIDRIENRQDSFVHLSPRLNCAILESVKLLRVLTQDHLSELNRAVASYLTVAHHSGERERKRLPRSLRRKPARFFPTDLRKSR
jgi:hypothetical protein